MKSLKLLGLAVSLPGLAIADTATAASASHPSTFTWSGWGGSYLNNHWAQGNNYINSSTVSSLALHCKIPDTAGQSAPPAIHGDYAYYPTYNGSFVALNYVTCQVQWRVNVTKIIDDFSPITPLKLIAARPITRTSPQIDLANSAVYFGTQINALLVAVDLSCGDLLAVKQVNPHPLATMTGSPTLYNNMIFTGVSSGEESAAFVSNGAYQCCSFIGNAAAFHFHRTGLSTGSFTTVWNVTTIPPNLPTNGTGRWSGAGIWGSQPSIDVARNQVFYGTGNTYTVPDAYLACANSSSLECVPSSILQESILALDIPTGRANWVRRIDSLDVWTLVCGAVGIPHNSTLCPWNPGPDADFGMAPAFVPGSLGVTPAGRDMVTLGQKSGVLYGLAADTGEVLWSTMTSPGSALGGLSWGIAAAAGRVFYTGINYAQERWVLQPQNTTAVSNSVLGAASARDGSLLWQVPAPGQNMSMVIPAVVNDVLLTGATGPFAFSSPGPGTLIAMKAATGEIVWEYSLENNFQGGIAVQGPYVFLGTGYKDSPGGAFWVFKLGG